MNNKQSEDSSADSFCEAFCWISRDDKMPKPDERIIAGSYRNGKWSMSSVSEAGWDYWIDSDRTHWFAVPLPPPPSLQNKTQQ